MKTYTINYTEELAIDVNCPYPDNNCICFSIKLIRVDELKKLLINERNRSCNDNIYTLQLIDYLMLEISK